MLKGVRGYIADRSEGYMADRSEGYMADRSEGYIIFKVELSIVYYTHLSLLALPIRDAQEPPRLHNLLRFPCDWNIFWCR